MPQLFKNLRNKILGQIPITNHSYSTGGFGLENFFDGNNLTHYKESLYLYIGVSMIARRAAGVPLELHKILNQKGETEEVFEHELLDIIYQPNQFQTQREFMEVSFAHYLLSGDTFWYLSRNGNKIESIVPLMPHLLDIILSPDNKRIIAYEYRATEYLRLDPDDIVHIKNPDPTNFLRGVGVVRPASVRIQTEKEAAKYQAKAFYNEGRPDIAVFFKRPMQQEQAAEAREMWDDIYNRQGKKVGFFGNEYDRVEKLNVNPKEMDFIETQKFLRDDILAALRIPKAMVTSDDVNLSNAKEAYRMYLQEAVIPTLEAFTDAMNNRLAPKVDEQVFWSFQDPTPNDRDMELKEVTELKKNGIITANEARERYEYEQLEGADELSANTNNARVALADEARSILRTRPVLVKRLKAQKSLSNVFSAPERQMNSIFATRELKAQYAKSVNESIDRKAETLKDAIDTFHKGQLDRILATELTLNDFMDVDDEKKRAKDAFMPVVKQLYKEGGQNALDALFAKSADNFFADEFLLATIAERVQFFANSMTETTFGVLKQTIRDGIKQGAGTDTIARTIRDRFDEMSVSRSRTIARTETSYAISKATNDAYNQSSVVTGKEWISAGDSKVRAEHQENDGVIVPKGAAFPNGEEYAGQHSINCRCTIAPAI